MSERSRIKLPSEKIPIQIPKEISSSNVGKYAEN
jgi:hypothetical protein